MNEASLTKHDLLLSIKRIQKEKKDKDQRIMIEALDLDGDNEQTLPVIYLSH